MLRGEAFTARARVGYSSADESWTEGVAIAGARGAFSGLLAYTRRDAQETENQGDNFSETTARTAPNPMDLSSNAVLGKLVWQAAPNHRLRLTYDHYDSDLSGDALSSRGPAMPPFQPNATLQVLGEDEQAARPGQPGPPLHRRLRPRSRLHGGLLAGRHDAPVHL